MSEGHIVPSSATSPGETAAPPEPQPPPDRHVVQRSHRQGFWVGTLLGIVVLAGVAASLVVLRSHIGAGGSRQIPSTAGHPVIPWKGSTVSISPTDNGRQNSPVPTVACQESAFTGTADSQEYSGSITFRVTLVYSGATPCYIPASGPAVRLVDNSGQAVATGGQTALVTYTPARLTVLNGDVVTAGIRWYQWCGSPTVAVTALHLRLADSQSFDDAHTIRMPVPASGHPGCAAADQHQAALSTYRPVVTAGSSPQSLAVRITSPAQAPSGSALEYTVRLTNNGPESVSFDRCPAIQQTLLDGSTGMMVLRSISLLNCPQSSVAPQQSIDFQMRLQLPPTAGGYTLAWSWYGLPGNYADQRVLELTS